MRVPISYFDQVLEKRKSQTRQVFKFAGINLAISCENGQELRKSRNLIPGEFNIFKVIKALFQKNVVLSITL